MAMSLQNKQVLIEKAEKLQTKLQSSGKIKNRKHLLKSYKKCFVGKEAVAVIIALKLAPDEAKAIEFGNQLIAINVMKHVVDDRPFEKKKYFYVFNNNYKARFDAEKEAQQNLQNKNTATATTATTATTTSPQSAIDQKSDDIKIDENINQITVYVIQGRNLPRYDVGPNAASDPYVKVTIGAAGYRTDAVRRELNPVWNSSFIKKKKGLFKKIQKIKFDLYDHDTISTDDFMGSCSINTDQNPNSHYSTPVQWLELTKDNAPVIGKNGKKSAIQIKIKYTLNAAETNIRYYTHVLQLKIKKGKNIRSKEFFGKSDPYVKCEWGTQSYQTKYVLNTNKPEWNETTYIFVHNEFQKKYQLKLTVMDADITADDLLGSGYVSANQIFTKTALNPDNPYLFDVTLRMVPVNLDRGLLGFMSPDNKNKYKEWGDIECECLMIPRAKIEAGFFKKIAQSFDKNADGMFDKEEVAQMFAELDVVHDVDQFFSKFDDNNDAKLDENEVISMLSDSNFQGSELATQLIGLYLSGDLDDNDYQKHLMSGFSNRVPATNRAIVIKDRHTGLLVQEFIPGYVWYSLKLLYNTKLNRAIVQSNVAHKILHTMSKKNGIKMDKPQSSTEIPAFIKQHNLDTKTLYKKPTDFKTFNDFFSRGMNVAKYRLIDNPDDESVIVSPADCRMMLWDSILDSAKYWIKGKLFTLENLIQSNNTKIDFHRYTGGSFVIARLAPQDYHRWHWPLSGKVLCIEKIPGALYTVNPIAINKSVDVYTSNKRAVLEIDAGINGRYLMFVIAATMVGSYYLHKKEAVDPTKNNPIPLQVNDDVKRGDVAGEFRFGGSTILLLFEPNRCKFDDDILRNVNDKFETLITVRSRIGRIKPKSTT